MAGNEFEVVVAEVDGRSVVRVAGDVDVASAPTLRTALLALMNVGEREVALDLAGVTFMDSSGVGVIGEVLRTGGWVTIAGASDQVQRLLEITGLIDLCTDASRDGGPSAESA